MPTVIFSKNEELKRNAVRIELDISAFNKFIFNM